MNYEEFRKESEKSGDIVAYMITDKKPRPGILGKLARILKISYGWIIEIVELGDGLYINAETPIRDSKEHGKPFPDPPKGE